VYWECAECGFLTNDSRVGSGERACPACGSIAADGLRQFPPERQRMLDARIRRYHADEDYEIVVILGATLLETLIEDVLARIMESQGADVRLRAAVLDTQRSIGQRLGKLFPTLTGEQFEDAAAELGFREFPRRWRRLRAERNAFIHDSAFEEAREQLNSASAEETMHLLDQAYQLFVMINNRFIAGPHRGRRS
jgi:rubrerythrin